jgi:hypothetical protein
MSKKIDLNSSEFDSKEINIFNDGEIGVAQNIKVSIVKGEEDKPINYPDFHLKFTDDKGGEVDKGFYFLDTENPDFEKRGVGLGKELKHIWGNILGKDTEIPGFDSYKEMLNGMMLEFKKACDANPEKLYRVAVAYGTTDRPQKYLRVVFYPPYFESMEVKAEETRVGLPRNAQRTPFKEDARDATYDQDREKPTSSGW